MRKEIDINNWPRKKAFNTFEDFDDPYTGITTSLNITNIVNLSKNTGNSFYGTMLYYILTTMNEIDAFKYGYGKDNDNNVKVYKYDDIAATITVLNSNNELNFSRYIKFDEDYNRFIQDFTKSKLDAENDVEYYKIHNLENMNKIQITCLPWTRFSNFKDATDRKEKSSKPKICWGKYYEVEGEYYIDLSILVNHAFQDGFHIGTLISKLQENIFEIDLGVNKCLPYKKVKK